LQSRPQLADILGLDRRRGVSPRIANIRQDVRNLSVLLRFQAKTGMVGAVGAAEVATARLPIRTTRIKDVGSTDCTSGALAMTKQSEQGNGLQRPLAPGRWEGRAIARRPLKGE
jgi:hypothetical protein